MDALECRSPSRCRTCVHSTRAGGCDLEEQLALALDALAAPRRIPVAVAKPVASA